VPLVARHNYHVVELTSDAGVQTSPASSLDRPACHDARVFEDTKTLAAPPDQPLRLWIEPWGDGREFPAGTLVTLRARSPHAGRLEIIPADDATWIYAWHGVTLEILVDGEQVALFDISPPAIPEGMSMREFVGGVLGAVPGISRERREGSRSRDKPRGTTVARRAGWPRILWWPSLGVGALAGMLLAAIGFRSQGPWSYPEWTFWSVFLDLASMPVAGYGGVGMVLGLPLLVAASVCVYKSRRNVVAGPIIALATGFLWMRLGDLVASLGV
jgi:hypothetical protein